MSMVGILMEKNGENHDSSLVDRLESDCLN